MQQEISEPTEPTKPLDPRQLADNAANIMAGHFTVGN
jgi:hypothetical protein